METMTITEALAELPTIEKRIARKREFIMNYLFRQSAVRDPHEKDGGSVELIRRELQSIDDLCERRIRIRAAIQKVNQEQFIAISSKSRTIADWLTWRREIASAYQDFLKRVSARLNELRATAMKQGVSVKDQDSGFSADYVVNMNEKALADQMESHENVLGTLDGQLSLKNATITISF